MAKVSVPRPPLTTPTPPALTTPVAEVTTQHVLVAYHIICCPACHSDDTHITRTVRPVRYHKCRACDHTFKSHEVRPPVSRS